MRRLVSLAVFKASTMVCLLNLHAMSVPPAGCVSSDCNWTQGTFFLEYVSGFFWLNNGIFTALSITSRLAAGRPWLSVLAHQWAQAAALLVAGALARVSETYLQYAYLDPLLLPADAAPFVRVPFEWREQLRSALSQKRALSFHGGCNAFGSLALLLLLRRGRAPSGRTVAALVTLGGLMLVLNPLLRAGADVATCCAQVCELHQTPIATAGELPIFRVPTQCMVVRGGGLVSASHRISNHTKPTPSAAFAHAASPASEPRV